jgi:hypothetical protein
VAVGVDDIDAVADRVRDCDAVIVRVLVWDGVVVGDAVKDGVKLGVDEPVPVRAWLRVADDVCVCDWEGDCVRLDVGTWLLDGDGDRVSDWLWDGLMLCVGVADGLQMVFAAESCMPGKLTIARGDHTDRSEETIVSTAAPKEPMGGVDALPGAERLFQ